ncbi:MAG TPA: HAMP domain-containing sensor histidine kinase [Egicoccus sp.]|nr:HAMP domain-containing sensor histidine kinase [Egicoccus sp.]HSK21596.1 HAMP domain-containing sensor histidine kinase [Egicoccus sp.]
MLRSLRNRLVLFTLAIVAVSVLAGDLAMTLTLHQELDEQMQRALSARVALVEELGGLSAQQLHDVLARRDIPAVVEAPDGTRLVSRADVVADPGATRTIERSDGGRVQIVVGRGTTEANLRRIYVAIAAGSIVAVLASVLVLGAFARRVLRPLESALQTARAAEQRSRRFLADAAHQLRTPVAGVRAASEALLRSPEPAQQDQLLTNLAREAVRTGHLLDALLRVARLDRGDQPTRTATDLVALVGEEVERQQALAPSLRLGLDAPAEHVVAVDATALREAVANLLDNARRHAQARVDVSLAPRARGGVVIRVVDDGPGLEPGTEDAVFDRFVSLDDRGGSGLGLAIVRGVARAHDGEVEWRDGGFELRLPGG